MTVQNELAQPLHGYVQNQLITELTWEHVVAMQAAEITNLRDQNTELSLRLEAVTLDRDIAQMGLFTDADTPADA